jgi:hypothetical protein
MCFELGLSLQRRKGLKHVLVVLWLTGVRHLSGALHQIFITDSCRLCWCGVPTLIRGSLCHLWLLLVLSSGAILEFKSHRTHDHIFTVSDSTLPQLGMPCPCIIPQEQGSLLNMQGLNSTQDKPMDWYLEPCRRKEKTSLISCLRFCLEHLVYCKQCIVQTFFLKLQLSNFKKISAGVLELKLMDRWTSRHDQTYML